MCERREKKDGENRQLLQRTYVPKTMKMFYFHTNLLVLDTVPSTCNVTLESVHCRVNMHNTLSTCTKLTERVMELIRVHISALNAPLVVHTCMD